MPWFYNYCFCSCEIRYISLNKREILTLNHNSNTEYLHNFRQLFNLPATHFLHQKKMRLTKAPLDKAAVKSSGLE